MGIGPLAFTLLMAVVATAGQAQIIFDNHLLVTPYVCCPQFPTSFAFLPTPPGQPLQVLVLEKFSGRVKHFVNGVFQNTVLDLPVSNYGERGLLGIALHPDFDNNSFVYLYYTASPTTQDEPAIPDVLENRVERFTWTGSALVAPQLILRLPARPDFNHLGGVILFGPDDMLYGVIGNVGRFGQLQNARNGDAPDTTSIVFRVQDDGTPPANNPFFAMGGAMQYTYGYGIRNSFGIEFDPVSGSLWETENGTDVYDEINRFPPAFNNGFAEILGPVARDPQGTSTLWTAPGAQYIDPQFSWLATIAPTAIHFLRSDSLGASYRNDVFVGAHLTGEIYHFELSLDRLDLVMPDASVVDRVADTVAERNLFLWATGFGSVVDLDTGPDAALYVLSFSTGTLYRIARDPASAAPGLGDVRRVQLLASPNPFRHVTRLKLVGVSPELAAQARVAIYDVAGRLVRKMAAGGADLEWDGRDNWGQQLAPGVYFVRLRVHGDAPLERSIVLQH